MVEWCWDRYNPQILHQVYDSKVRVVKAVFDAGGSNEYTLPRSGSKKSRLLSLIPYITSSSPFTIRPRRQPHDLSRGDRIEVRMRTDEGMYEWFAGEVLETDEKKEWCRVRYEDDGEVWRDFFDGREGSVLWRRIEKQEVANEDLGQNVFQ